MQMLDSRGGSAPFDDSGSSQNYDGPPSDSGGGLEDDIPF
jgi:hypothetical protein